MATMESDSGLGTLFSIVGTGLELQQQLIEIAKEGTKNLNRQNRHRWGFAEFMFDGFNRSSVETVDICLCGTFDLWVKVIISMKIEN